MPPSGDIVALDWSPDGREILLAGSTRPSSGCSSGTSRRTRSASSTTRPAPSSAISGSWRPTSARTAREIVCRWEDFGQPRRLIGLDPADRAPDPDDPGERRGAARARAPQRFLPDDRWHGAAPGLARCAGGRPPYPVILETHGGPTAATFPNFHRAGAGVPRRRLRVPVAQLPRARRRSAASSSTRSGAGWASSRSRTWRPLGPGSSTKVSPSPDRILLTGWSYGGFLTLLGLGPPAGPVGGRHGRRRDRGLGDELRGLERPPAVVPADVVRRGTRRARRRDARWVAD